MFSFSNTIKTLSSVSALSFCLSMNANADVTFHSFPLVNGTGGGLSWMQVSNNGEVVYAKKATDDNITQGYKWSPEEGEQLIANSFYASIRGATAGNGQFVNISNDGSVTRFGNDVYINGTHTLTTNIGATKHASSLSGNGAKVSVQNSGSNPSIIDIATGNETLITDTLPKTNYIISDFSSDARAALLSPGTNFLYTAPYFIKDVDGSLIEIDYPYGIVNDLSGDGATVIGSSSTCLNSYTCVLITDANGTTEIAGQAFSASGLNYDGSIAALTYQGPNYAFQGYVWNTENGLRNIVDVLATQNIDISDWSKIKLNDISDNGFFIVGDGYDPQGQHRIFVINATPQCAPNGLF